MITTLVPLFAYVLQMFKKIIHTLLDIMTSA